MGGDRCDVAVVGDGPAGSSAARQAAALGCRVVLFEKAAMPRPKLCGGAVSEQALRSLGFALPERLVDAACFGTRVHYGSDSMLGRSDERVAVLVRREHFDHFLVEKAQEAGARVRVGEVTAITRVGDEMVLQTRDDQTTCAVVIIAEGTAGRLAKDVRRPDRNDESGVCLECRVPSAQLPQFADLKDVIDVYLGVARGGYGWVFPHGDFYSVGIGGLRSDLPAPRRVFETFCRDLQIDVDRTEVHGHLIPCGGVRRNLVSDGVILAGDAAGFVDAFLGEGITYAIRSGRISGEVAARAVQAKDAGPATLTTYGQTCEMAFGRNLRYALRLARLARRYPSMFMRLLATERTVLDRYLGVARGDRSYGDFVWWLGLRAPALWLRGLSNGRRAPPHIAGR
jgi:geranylgeranyl reductase family protein